MALKGEGEMPTAREPQEEGAQAPCDLSLNQLCQ